MESVKSPAVVLKEAVQFSKDVLQEGRRVVWPGRRDVVVTSIIVFVLAAIFAVFFFFMDQIIALAIRFILGMGGL